MINRVTAFPANNKLAVFPQVAAGCVAGRWSVKHVGFSDFGYAWVYVVFEDRTAI